jgi:hypothetical protein
MAKRTLLILLLSVAISTSPTFALNEDADFVGYMENLEKMERERERINRMLEEHEVCSSLETVLRFRRTFNRVDRAHALPLTELRYGDKQHGEDMPCAKFKP